MGFSTVLVISLAAGVILIVGGGLMMYMANLVKSAYEIKVQINTDVDERLNKMSEDLDKKSRWIKRDLLEEIDKIKTALQTDNARKIEDLGVALRQKLDGFEALLHNERVEWVKAVDADRQAIAHLESRFKSTAKAVKKVEEQVKPAELEAAIDAAVAAVAGATSAVGAEPGEAAKPAAAKPNPSAPVGNFLQELGGPPR